MSATLDRDLRDAHGCRSLPICKDDEVKIMTGKLKGREGKVTCVYRKRFYILVERVNRFKSDGREPQLCRLLPYVSTPWAPLLSLHDGSP